MNENRRSLRDIGKRILSLRRYLQGGNTARPGTLQHGLALGRESQSHSGAGHKRGPGEWGAEPSDPLETSILGGDREEYIDKSFWHDAESGGVTFQESRVDGTWDENGGEPWK